MVKSFQEERPDIYNRAMRMMNDNKLSEEAIVKMINSELDTSAKIAKVGFLIKPLIIDSFWAWPELSDINSQFKYSIKLNSLSIKKISSIETLFLFMHKS